MSNDRVASTRKQAPFSFTELNADPRLSIIAPSYFTASDDCTLAYFDYRTKNVPAQTLLFIHGGGACSGLGYQYLADSLSTKYDTRVILLDMRGHGLSDGKRGDAPSKERLWQDVSDVIQLVKAEGAGPIYLGGHSSGGGLILNYATWKRREAVNGYVFVSPKLGYKSNADRYPFTDDPFAKPHIPTIIVNKISNETINAHAIAVEMNYPEAVMSAEPLFVNKYTCAVINAITPNKPKEQFGLIDKPYYLIVGENDELMLPENTLRYFEFSSKKVKSGSRVGIIANQTHLGILRVAGDVIGGYVRGLTL
jgi:acylglycerol lipase